MDGAGQPITWPVTPYYQAGAGAIDITTGLGYPKKADDAERNPRVSLLFCDPTGSGIDAPCAVLVQGTAQVDYSDLDANRERYWRESGEKLPATKEHAPALVPARAVQLVLHPDLRVRAPGARVRLERRRLLQGPDAVRHAHGGGALASLRGARDAAAGAGGRRARVGRRAWTSSGGATRRRC